MIFWRFNLRTRCGHWCQNIPCGRVADIKNHQLLLTFPYWENGIKKAGSLEFTGFPLFIPNETRGIRTPDNLIKSQVLYQLS